MAMLLEDQIKWQDNMSAGIGKGDGRKMRGDSDETKNIGGGSTVEELYTAHIIL